jgi:hypothetical protein
MSEDRRQNPIIPWNKVENRVRCLDPRADRSDKLFKDRIWATPMDQLLPMLQQRQTRRQPAKKRQS